MKNPDDMISLPMSSLPSSSHVSLLPFPSTRQRKRRVERQRKRREEWNLPKLLRLGADAPLTWSWNVGVSPPGTVSIGNQRQPSRAGLAICLNRPLSFPQGIPDSPTYCSPPGCPQKTSAKARAGNID